MPVELKKTRHFSGVAHVSRSEAPLESDSTPFFPFFLFSPSATLDEKGQGEVDVAVLSTLHFPAAGTALLSRVVLSFARGRISVTRPGG